MNNNISISNDFYSNFSLEEIQSHLENTRMSLETSRDNVSANRLKKYYLIQTEMRKEISTYSGNFILEFSIIDKKETNFMQGYKINIEKTTDYDGVTAIKLKFLDFENKNIYVIMGITSYDVRVPEGINRIENDRIRIEFNRFIDTFNDSIFNDFKNQLSIYYDRFKNEEIERLKLLQEDCDNTKQFIADLIQQD